MSTICTNLFDWLTQLRKSGGPQLGNSAALKDAPVIKAMHELAAQYPRYGYRRILYWTMALDGDDHMTR